MYTGRLQQLISAQWWLFSIEFPCDSFSIHHCSVQKIFSLNQRLNCLTFRGVWWYLEYQCFRESWADSGSLLVYPTSVSAPHLFFHQVMLKHHYWGKRATIMNTFPTTIMASYVFGTIQQTYKAATGCYKLPLPVEEVTPFPYSALRVKEPFVQVQKLLSGSVLRTEGKPTGLALCCYKCYLSTKIFLRSVKC